MTLINPDEQNSSGSMDGSNTAIKLKAPKRILHFSDGILEEYSDDEVDNPKTEQALVEVDPATLTWGPWFWYKAWRAGSGTLSVLDTMGEYLAAFFGITTPKYYFELEEYKKRNAESKEEKEKAQGWSEASRAQHFVDKDVNTAQPRPVDV